MLYFIMHFNFIDDEKFRFYLKNWFFERCTSLIEFCIYTKSQTTAVSPQVGVGKF